MNPGMMNVVGKQQVWLLYLLLATLMGQRVCAQSAEKGSTVRLQSFKLSFSSNSTYAPFVFTTGGDADNKQADSFYYKSRIVMEARLQSQSIQDETYQWLTKLSLTPGLFQVSDEGLSQEPVIADVSRILSIPVYVRSNDSGRVLQVYFDTEVTSTYRQLWSQLIAYMQCIVPAIARQQPGIKPQTTASHQSVAKPPSTVKPPLIAQQQSVMQGKPAAWNITEEDRVGFFNARYEQLPATEQPAISHFTKTGTGYAIFPGQGMVDYAQQLKADYALYNDELRDIILNELLQVIVKGKNKATTSSVFKLYADTTKTTTRTSESEIDTVSVVAGDLKPGEASYDTLRQHFRVAIAASAAVTLSNFVTRHELKTTMHRQVLGQLTLHDVLQAIDTLTIEEGKADKDRVNRKVAALVYLYPALLDTFMQRIAQEPPLSPPFRIVLTGFAQAGTAAAQEKIGGLLYQHQHNAEAVDLFTNTLLFLEQPDAHFIATIQRIAYNRDRFDAPVQEALRYLLGSFSHSLKKTNPALGMSTILATLAAIKQESRKPEKEKVLALLAIAGNAGIDTAFTEISSYVNHAEEDIRVQALFALRLLNTTAADELLLGEFTRDTSSITKRAILTVFRYRPITPSVLQAVVGMLKVAGDESLAINGLRFLYENKKRYPQVLPLLQKMAMQTTSARLRKEINTLLNNKTD